MTATLSQASFVIAANAHNPSILNHDWLFRNEILPGEEADWKLAAPAIITPPVSTLEYQNGTKIVLETNKLSVNCVPLAGKVTQAQIDNANRIAVRYADTLRHVPYTAIGNNLKMLFDCENAHSRLIECFGGSGPWTDGLGTVQTKMTYKRVGHTRNIEISSGKGKFVDETGAVFEKDAVLIGSNYHHDIDTYEEAIRVLQDYRKDLSDFGQFVEQAAGFIRG